MARIFLRSGKGQITVNGRPFDHYFVNESARAMVRQPLLATEVADKFDRRAEFDAAGVFKDLDFDFFSGDFDHLAF